MLHLRSPKLYEFFIALWPFVIGIARRLWGVRKRRVSYPTGAEKRKILVFIDMVSLVVYFLSLLSLAGCQYARI
jgi:hypothetical protein